MFLTVTFAHLVDIIALSTVKIAPLVDSSIAKITLKIVMYAMILFVRDNTSNVPRKMANYALNATSTVAINTLINVQLVIKFFAITTSRNVQIAIVTDAKNMEENVQHAIVFIVRNIVWVYEVAMSVVFFIAIDTPERRKRNAKDARKIFALNTEKFANVAISSIVSAI